MVQNNKEIKIINTPPRKLTFMQIVEMISQKDKNTFRMIEQSLNEMRNILRRPPLPKGKITMATFTSKNFQQYCTWQSETNTNTQTKN
jgi:hypothetical protein